MSDESEVEDEPTLDNWPVRLGQRMFEALLGPPDARDVSDLLALAIESYGEAQWWRAVSGQQVDEIERLCARIVDLESRRDPEGPSGTTWCRKETRGEATISLSGSAATEREGLRLPDAAPPPSEPRRDPDAKRFKEALAAIHSEASTRAHRSMDPTRRHFEELARLAHEALHGLRPDDLPDPPADPPGCASKESVVSYKTIRDSP